MPIAGGVQYHINEYFPSRIAIFTDKHKNKQALSDLLKRLSLQLSKIDYQGLTSYLSFSKTSLPPGIIHTSE